eukprot:4448651-Amphidinium_carterae.1
MQSFLLDCTKLETLLALCYFGAVPQWTNLFTGTIIGPWSRLSDTYVGAVQNDQATHPRTKVACCEGLGPPETPQNKIPPGETKRSKN